MIVTIIRTDPSGEPWIVAPEDGSRAELWRPSQEAEAELRGLMGAANAARFNAEWAHGAGERQLLVREALA